jgi:hypothetical protein
MPFKKGQSGNPKGKPKGALNKTAMPAQQLLEADAQEITRKVIELAKQGNPMALKLCLERILPPRTERPIALKLPEVNVASDVPRALNAILASVSRGAITPSEAGILAGVVGAAHQAKPKLPLELYENELTREDLEDPQVQKAYLTLMAEVRRSRRERKACPTPMAAGMIRKIC